MFEGVTGGMTNLAAMTYAAEIADSRYRGSLITVNIIMFLSGIAVGAGLGIALTWYEVALVCDGLLVVNLIVVPLLPESPTFLVITDRKAQAAEVIRSLRESNCNVENELLMIKEMNTNKDTTVTWRDMIRGDNIKRVMIILGLFIVQSFCGVLVLRSNIPRVLQAAGIKEDLELWTTVILLAPVGGGFLQTLLMDRIGRRLCLVISLAPTAMFCLLLGIYSCLIDQQKQLG